jgi:hypothetical protein
MQYYPFSVAVGASHHVLARGNFLRYYEALTGTANPTLEIKPMGSGGAGSSEFLLRPGQSIKLPVSVPGFMIENFDGIATITGRLLIGEGDFNDSVISGNVTVTGTVLVSESSGTQFNTQANVTVGTSQVLLQNLAGTKKLVLLASPSNTGQIAIIGSGGTLAQSFAVLAPGETWIEEDNANGPIYAIADAAGQTLKKGYIF